LERRCEGRRSCLKQADQDVDVPDLGDERQRDNHGSARDVEDDEELPPG
jgi:hypothetical protein